MRNSNWLMVLFLSVFCSDAGAGISYSKPADALESPLKVAALQLTAAIDCRSQAAPDKLATIRKMVEEMPEAFFFPLRERNGNSPAHIAIECGNIEALRIVLGMPLPNLSIKNIDGDTLAHFAARKADPAFVCMLIERNKELFSETNLAGDTPVFIAYAQKNYVTLDRLNQQISATNRQRNRDGKTLDDLFNEMDDVAKGEFGAELARLQRLKLIF